MNILDFVISLFNIVRLRIRCKKLDDNCYKNTTLIKDNSDNYTPTAKTT